MTENGTGDDEAFLRNSTTTTGIGRWFGGGMLGVFLCVLMVAGIGWSQAGEAETEAPLQTVAFSQAVQCRLRMIVSQPPSLAVGQSQPETPRSASDCDEMYAVVPAEVIADSPQKYALQHALAETPMQSFVDTLMRYAPTTRALAVGIAKQESDWGRQSPQKSGRDCYNYWGYKGVGENGSVSGYACFATPEEAVGVVVGRIDSFVQKGLSTPEKMLVWKCGSSCAGQSPESVSRWLGVVGSYYRQLNQG